MEKKINSWLRKYGKSFFDQDFGYSDCDMVDSCMHDLSLDESARALVNKMVDAYIAAV